MNFIIVDDNITFRDSLQFFIETSLKQNVIGIFSDGLEFLENSNNHLADIILMDIEMANLNGIDAVKKALWENPFLKFIAITSYTERAYLLDLLDAGFKGCVFKTKIFDELEKAIYEVNNGNYYFPDDIKIIEK